ncbi:MAG: hypothetical protein HQK77_03370 [Desulfobacterales bacterium]|nr:hypothetical protein [Desulfobacterales bacterium]
MSGRPRLGDILVKKNLISPEKIEEALRIQTGGNRRLGYILIKMGLITDDQLLEALSDQNEIPLVDIEKEFSKNASRILPRYLCRKYSVLPISLSENNVLTLAMVNPLDTEAIDDIDHYTGLLVQPKLASQRDISHAISMHIPFTLRDIIQPLLYSRFAQVITTIAILFIFATCYYIYQDIQLEKFGTESIMGPTTVYNNHSLMVGVEEKGTISLIGHGPYSKGFYSVVFDNTEGLKQFIMNKQNHFTEKQFRWLMWLSTEKLPKKLSAG